MSPRRDPVGEQKKIREQVQTVKPSTGDTFDQWYENALALTEGGQEILRRRAKHAARMDHAVNRRRNRRREQALMEQAMEQDRQHARRLQRFARARELAAKPTTDNLGGGEPVD